MLDLYNKKYDMKTLKKHIHEVKLIDILKTQTIDVEFAVNYILNSKYQLNEDDNIIAPDIIKHQPHISYEDLQKELQKDDSDDEPPLKKILPNYK
jgi:hypothetical protein